MLIKVQIYVKNKAGLTVPGRQIPGHWPTPVPEALAMAEPVTILLLRPFLSAFFSPPPTERVLAKLGRQRASGALEP